MENGSLDSRREDEEVALFASLRALSETMTTEGKICKRRFDPERFESLVDNLALIRPAPRFGDFRFTFYGSAFSEVSPGGDLNGVAFGELLGSPYYRTCLSGFWHVHRVGLAHVSRDHPIVGGRKRFFTRLLIPVFAGNRTALILCTAMLHDKPTRQTKPGLDEPLPFAASA
jgi:hypothetical protein